MVTPSGGAKCRWVSLNAGVVNLIRSQVCHTDRPLHCITFSVMQRVARVCQRQLILARIKAMYITLLVFYSCWVFTVYDRCCDLCKMYCWAIIPCQYAVCQQLTGVRIIMRRSLKWVANCHTICWGCDDACCRQTWLVVPSASPGKVTLHTVWISCVQTLLFYLFSLAVV